MVKIKRLIPNVDAVLEQMGLSFVAGGNLNGVMTLEMLTLPLT